MDEQRWPSGAGPRLVVFPPFCVDVVEYQLWRHHELVAMKPRALQVLGYLVSRAGQLVDKQELLARFWGDIHVSDGVLKSQIREIRSILGDSARQPRFIQTVHRRGYRFIGGVDRRPPGAALAWLRGV